MKSRILLLAAAVALVSCREPGSRGIASEFEVRPQAVSFAACPTQDENGAAVEDVYPDQETLKIRNLGRAPGNVVLTLQGNDASAFSLPNGANPGAIEGSGELDVPIQFSPSKKGDAVAELLVDDGNPDSEPVSVVLNGNALNLPAQPTLSVELQNKDTQTQFDACVEGLPCVHYFPDTYFQQSTELTVRIENKGCPALRITDMELEPLLSTSLDFTIDSPSIKPTTEVPITLSTADDNASTDWKVRFAPQNDGSLDTTKQALLRIKTNDPQNPSFDIQLIGVALVPNISVSPTFCDFSIPNAPCKVAGQNNKAQFVVSNDGNAPVTIDSITFQNGGHAGRFTLSQNITGTTLQPATTAIVEVTHTDAPLYVADLMSINAKSSGQNAGSALVSLFGGTKPCLETDPLDQLDFNNPATQVSTKTITIKNLATKNNAACGNLIVNRVFVDPSSFFAIVEPKIPEGSTVAPGAGVVATVQYTKPISGGTQAGTLRIDTNDFDYGPPPYKVVQLYSNAPTNFRPTASLKGCLPTDTTCANGVTQSMYVRLSQPELGNPKKIIAWGKESVDPGNPNPPGISGYRFQLIKPPNAPSASLDNDGQIITSPTAELTLDPVMTNGMYRIVLTVFDDTNQPSSPVDLKIFVSQ